VVSSFDRFWSCSGHRFRMIASPLPSPHRLVGSQGCLPLPELPWIGKVPPRPAISAVRAKVPIKDRASELYALLT
jgi:hypothetical protein